MEHPNSVLQLRMSLYGAKQAGRNWFQEATRILCDELKYNQLQKDPYNIIRRDGDGMVIESTLL